MTRPRDLRVTLIRDGKLALDVADPRHPRPAFCYRDLRGRNRAEQHQLMVRDNNGDVLIEWQPEAPRSARTARSRHRAGSPEKVATIEELYLTGLHLEQYRHATRRPKPTGMRACDAIPTMRDSTTPWACCICAQASSRKRRHPSRRAVEGLRAETPTLMMASPSTT